MSKTYSPHIIMTGKSLDFKKSCKLHFGADVRVHKGRNVTNTLEEITQEEICLGPTGNLKGTYNFFLLRSGNKTTRGQLTKVHAPTIFIKRVAAIALAGEQNEGILFENRTGTTVNNIFQMTKRTKRLTKFTGIFQEWTGRRNPLNRKYKSRQSIYCILKKSICGTGRR